MLTEELLNLLVKVTWRLCRQLFNELSGAELYSKLLLAIVTGMNRAAISGSRVGGGGPGKYTAEVPLFEAEIERIVAAFQKLVERVVN